MSFRTGSARNVDKEEYPVPKSSRAQVTPIFSNAIILLATNAASADSADSVSSSSSSPGLMPEERMSAEAAARHSSSSSCMGLTFTASFSPRVAGSRDQSFKVSQP